MLANVAAAPKSINLDGCEDFFDVLAVAGGGAALMVGLDLGSSSEKRAVLQRGIGGETLCFAHSPTLIRSILCPPNLPTPNQ